jgi:hypothetical protein
MKEGRFICLDVEYSWTKDDLVLSSPKRKKGPSLNHMMLFEACFGLARFIEPYPLYHCPATSLSDTFPCPFPNAIGGLSIWMHDEVVEAWWRVSFKPHSAGNTPRLVLDRRPWGPADGGERPS